MGLTPIPEIDIIFSSAKNRTHYPMTTNSNHLAPMPPVQLKKWQHQFIVIFLEI